MTDEKIKSIFGEYGVIKSIKIKKPTIWTQNVELSGTSTSYGIAYVDYLNEEDA